MSSERKFVDLMNKYGLMTCCSGGPDGYCIKIKTSTLSQAHEIHSAILEFGRSVKFDIATNIKNKEELNKENRKLSEKCKKLEHERDVAEQAAYPAENDRIEELEAEVMHLRKLLKLGGRSCLGAK